MAWLKKSEDPMQAALQRLIQLQVEVGAEQARSSREMAELRREQIRLEYESREKLAKVEADLREIVAKVFHILQELPDAIRQKIGFNPSTQ